MRDGSRLRCNVALSHTSRSSINFTIRIDRKIFPNREMEIIVADTLMESSVTNQVTINRTQN